MSVPRVGDEMPGHCTWCGKAIVLVRRLYDFVAEFYWSGERCKCINGLVGGRTSGAIMRMGRGAHRKPVRKESENV